MLTPTDAGAQRHKRTQLDVLLQAQRSSCARADRRASPRAALTMAPSDPASTDSLLAYRHKAVRDLAWLLRAPPLLSPSTGLEPLEAPLDDAAEASRDAIACWLEELDSDPEVKHVRGNLEHVLGASSIEDPCEVDEGYRKDRPEVRGGASKNMAGFGLRELG